MHNLGYMANMLEVIAIPYGFGMIIHDGAFSYQTVQ